MKKILLVIIILSISAAFLILKPSNKTDHDAGQVEDNIAYYTCGMHPSVKISPKQFNEGAVNCPICNMKLIPVEKKSKSRVSSGQTKILFYRHPDDPSMTSTTPASGQKGVKFVPVYESKGDDAKFYGCGMKGSEHIFYIQGMKGMLCPVCSMKLTELTENDAALLSGVVSRVSIKGYQAQLAGIKSQILTKQHLFKEIRTVGRVAYDPDLAITEEEFLSALKAKDKIDQGNIEEIQERANSLVNSVKRKLRLLGLSTDQIKELKDSRQIHTSLILPEAKMWIYGEVYEYELNWVVSGSKVTVTTVSVAGEKFRGVVSSINPVLDPKTRSVTFRAQVDNPGLKLKPQMYVDVIISSMYKGPDNEHMVLAVPKDAVLDTGLRKIVWLDKGDGEYEGREVNLGPQAVGEIDGKRVKFYPVFNGLNEGERIVTKANFLIDSQSQISGSASSSFGGALSGDEEGESSMPAGHNH